MTTEFRAMCAELIDALDSGIPAARIRMSPLANRARALLAQPVAEGPTDEELEKLAEPFSCVGEDGWTRTIYDEAGYARAVLTKWGRPTPQPVAVSERLPGPEDVNEDGNCWLWDREGCFWDWTYIRTRTRAEMYTYTHWLPANALPTPEATNE